MPTTGEFKSRSAGIPNPFDEPPPRISEYTAQEIATLQARLNRQLGPEFISTRQGPGGGKVAYVTAEKVINLANEVFGFNGWSSSIQNVQIDFVDESQSTGKISLGLSIIVRITLKDGTYHEDVGYGSIENARGKAAAFEKAKKEASTDALKRALRTFGNLLGNCLYDKDYLGRVAKLKAAPVKWDVEKLHRHPDYAVAKPEPPAANTAVKQEGLVRSRTDASSISTDFEDEFGGNLFDEVEISAAHGEDTSMTSAIDGDTLVEAPKTVKQNFNGMAPPAARHVQRMQSMPALQQQANNPAQPIPQPLQNDPFEAQKQQARVAAMARRAALQSNGELSAKPEPPRRIAAPNEIVAPSRPQSVQDQSMTIQSNGNGAAPTGQIHGQTRSNLSSAPDAGGDAQQNRSAGGSNPQNRSTPDQHPPAINPGANLPVTFVSSRAAEMLQQPISDISNPLPVFNPHAESPSLRRTSGINHTRSGPVPREVITPTAKNAQLGPPQHQGNFSNPGQPAVPTVQNAGFRTNYIDPRADTNRRIGMPGGAQSSLANRGAYKPPGPANGIKRPALVDVSNVTDATGGVQTEGMEAKKMKVNGV